MKQVTIVSRLSYIIYILIMTTNHFKWMAMLFMAALIFVACSSDDDLSLSDEHQSALDGA